MLDLKQLYSLLSLNERLQYLEMRRPNKTNTRRLYDLQVHRFEIYKCIIERLSAIVESQDDTAKKVA